MLVDGQERWTTNQFNLRKFIGGRADGRYRVFWPFFHPAYVLERHFTGQRIVHQMEERSGSIREIDNDTPMCCKMRYHKVRKAFLRNKCWYWWQTNRWLSPVWLLRLAGTAAWKKFVPELAGQLKPRAEPINKGFDVGHCWKCVQISGEQ